MSHTLLSHRRLARGLALFVVAALATIGSEARGQSGEGREGKKYAIVVGVETYRPEQKLPKLEFAEADATQLADVLQAGGYRVTLLTQTQARVPGKETLAPLADYIRDQLDGILRNPFLKENDTVLVALAGHGVQFEQVTGTERKPKFYFCPADAAIKDLRQANDITERHHLIALDELYDTLQKSKAGLKLLFVDACRNDPTAPGTTRSTNSVTLPKLPPPPGGVAAFFSCSANQEAVEDRMLKHGVFFHYLIDGLKGAADTGTDARPKDGVITLAELQEHVSGQVYDYVFEKYGRRQEPELKGELRSKTPVLKLALAPAGTLAPGLAKSGSVEGAGGKPGATPSTAGTPGASVPTAPAAGGGGVGAVVPGKKEVRNVLGMRLAHIPAGEFTMGSPHEELGRKENELPHKVRISKPYLMGVHEVTQKDFFSITGFNPSAYSPMGASRDLLEKIPNGFKEFEQYPVESLTWFDAVLFCNQLSAKDGLPPYYKFDRPQYRDRSIIEADVTIVGGKGYRLPTEAEWEYACRAGTQSVYHTGPTLAARVANVRGGEKDPDLGRPTVVGSYEANAFGLHDMHGNVAEWCQDWYGPQYYIELYKTSRDGAINPLGPGDTGERVLRGGGWISFVGNARSADRLYLKPSGTLTWTGFRVARDAE